jgi:hypothetical protein
VAAPEASHDTLLRAPNIDRHEASSLLDQELLGSRDAYERLRPETVAEKLEPNTICTPTRTGPAATLDGANVTGAPDPTCMKPVSVLPVRLMPMTPLGVGEGAGSG